MDKILALFDFDGTITKKDSFVEFIRFYRGDFLFFAGMLILSPIILIYKLNLLKNWQAKQFVLRFFFQGESIQAFDLKCQIFALQVIPKIVKRSAMSKIEEHLRNGDRVIVVTASAENWLTEWCKNMNLELIATRLEKRDGKITGKLDGKNCYGEEKRRRIIEYLNIKDYTKIYAYGDSKGDESLLDIADVKFYKYFN